MREINLEDFEDKLETERQEKLYQTMIFLLKLVLLGLIFRGILFLYPDTYGIQNAFASLIGAILSPFMHIQVNEIYLLTVENSYIIVQDCLGWKSMSVFTALFFSSIPIEKIRENLEYLLYGLAAIFVANIVRVATTVYLAEIGVISFEVIHSLLWRWGLTVIVFAVWLYWFTQILDTEGKDVDEETDSE